MQSRREFLKGAALMGAAATAGGCATGGRWFDCTAGAPMHGFAAPAIPSIRLGIVGMGGRGCGIVNRASKLPGVTITAICDNVPDKVARAQKRLADLKKPAAKEYLGDTAWRKLCEDPNVDVVYNTTPWDLHVPVQLAAMRGGKHVFTEVPSAFTVDECWELVETSEKTKRHCMQLENCCYGEIEMLTFNLAKLGMLGELVHGEGAYIHDLRELNYLDPAKGGYQGYWRLKWNARHYGNPYPTHGLLPIMQAMDVNRGDRFDYLTCVSSAQIGMDAFAKVKFGEDSWQAKLHPKCGDMSTTVIRTVKGRTIMVQHDVTSARPYSRINLLSGTQGCLNDYPFRIALAGKPGDPAHGWMDAAATAKLFEEYKHPLWKAAGALAQKMGGHGGMDFLMDLRLCYCLQNGLPLDMDVYDLASSCAVCELSERSALDRGNSVDVPDFTRGGWKTAKPLGIESVDLGKLGIMDVKKDDSQLNV